ncbi:MAG: hypothetical protein WAO83_18305 [Fuerstiella sp.]
MFFLSKQKRKDRRTLQYKQKIAQLCEVATEPARSQQGAVVTVMMTRKPDPQRGTPIAGDYLEYISPWWTTINKVGLHGIILHDGLPADFIADATTDCVSFQKCELGNFPILHQRHFAVRDYLQQSEHEFVLVTDVSDVAIKRDPFELIAANADNCRLFIGSEEKTIARNKCLRNELAGQYGEVRFSDRPVVNPGILGGRRQQVIDFLNLLTAEIEELGDRLLASDMSIINQVFHSHYDLSEVFTGSPLHSRFRKWDYNTPAAVMHK